MSNRDYMRIYRIIDSTISTLIVLSILASVAILLGACSADNDRARELDLAVKGSYTPGRTNGTGNLIPQGGTDEKSSSAPTKSVD